MSRQHAVSAAQKSANDKLFGNPVHLVSSQKELACCGKAIKCVKYPYIKAEATLDYYKITCLECLESLEAYKYWLGTYKSVPKNPKFPPITYRVYLVNSALGMFFRLVELKA